MASRQVIAATGRFSKAHRLHHKIDFDQIYRNGARHSNPHFLLLARQNSLPYPRIGLSISAKAAGNAINRNRVKRVVRESFRAQLRRLPAVDFVISARTAVKTATNAVLTRSLEQLWDKLASHA